MSNILIFIIVLSSLIVVHECGHFFVAKWFKIKVLEFGIGFPPRIFSIKYKGTIYSLNLFPLGGFVRLLGEEEPDHPDSILKRAIYQRFMVIIAGVLMNVFLTFILFSVFFMLPKNVLVGHVEINKIQIDSPAYQAGFKEHDIILNVDEKPIQNFTDLAYRINLKLGTESHWRIKRVDSSKALDQRSPEILHLTVIPRWDPPEKQGPTGIEVRHIMAHQEIIQSNFFKALYFGGERLIETLILLKNEITKWVLGIEKPSFSGPVGIAQATGEIAKVGGFISLLQFAALLSLNLAILNLLPLPMLDGGRLMFLGIEAVRGGKRVSAKRERFVHAVGFFSLMLLLIIVTVVDVQRIINGDSLFR